MAKNFWESSHFKQWIFDKDQLVTMRAKHWEIYSEREFAQFMVFWTNFIQALGQSYLQTYGQSGQDYSGVRMQVIATAVVYFKRFYLIRNFREVCPFALSCIAVLLASKTEEFGYINLPKLQASIREIMKRDCNIYFVMVHDVPRDLEFILAEQLDLSLIVFHPHRALDQLLENLQKDVPKNFDSLRRCCVCVVNDSLRTDAPLLFPPHIIAIASIITAAAILKRDGDIQNWLGSLHYNSELVTKCVEVINDMLILCETFNVRQHLLPLLQKLPIINITNVQGRQHVMRPL